MPFLARMGLQTKIMVLSLVGLAVLFGFFGYIGRQAVQQSTQLVFRERIAIAQSIAADIDNAIGYSVGELEKMAALTPIRNEGTYLPPTSPTPPSSSGCLTMCHDRAKVNVARVGIADVQGRLLRLEPHDFTAFEETGRSEAIQRAVQQATLKAKTSVVEAPVADTAEAATVLIATPLRDETGNISGALLLEIAPFSNVLAFDSGNNAGEGSYGVEVVDDHGLTIAGLGQRARLGEYSEHMSVAASLLKEGKSGAAIHEMPPGAARSDHVVAFAPFRTLAGGVIIDQNPETALAPLQALESTIFVFGGLALATTLVIVWLTTRSVVRPIRSLTLASQKITSGDLEHGIVAKGGDEIGLLARSFEEMRQRLKASQDEIEAWNRVLEERVQRRTQELSALVETSQVLASTLEMDTLLAATIDQARQMFPLADAGVLFLYDQATDLLALKTSFGYDPESSRAMTFSSGEDCVGQAFASKTTQVSHGEPLPPKLLENLSPENRAFGASDEGNQAQSCMCVPMIHEEQPLGTLVLFSLHHAGGFSEADAQLLRALANQVTIGIVNARLFKEASEVGTLRDLDRLKTEFVARASHELRTPLTSIKSLAETLLRPDLSLKGSQRREFLKGINNAADRLATIITDLLTVSRIESGRMELRIEASRLRPLVARVIQQVKAQDPDRPFAVEMPANLPPVLADVNRLEDILGNLLSNAMKYSPRSSVITVRASLSRGDDSEPSSLVSPATVVVSVSDGGVGISPEGMPRLFQRFGRVDESAHRGVGGVGLGLYICKVYAEAMHGSIWAESTLGKGSTFSFSLPAAPGSVSPQADRDPLKERPGIEPATVVGGGCVMVVDDDPDVLRAADVNLGASGFDVILASSGEQCLALLQRRRVDVIVLDVALPGIDGLEVARRLRANSLTKEIPIIFLTAKAQEKDEARAWEVGGNEYITKPFSPIQLCDRVAKIMGQD